MDPFRLTVALALAGMLCACRDAPAAGRIEAGTSPGDSGGPAALPPAGELAAFLADGEARIDALADSLDELLHPLPLLTSADERAFRTFRAADHLARAAQLGVDPADPGARERRLVSLPDSNAYWIVRELDHSAPLLTPSAVDLLEEVGVRFQRRLLELGLPPYRFEVTSALRTARQQARLRADNPNAAAGRSAHEYGTTVDIAYAGFAAPLEPALAFRAPSAPWLAEHLQRDAAARLETVAARRSRELQAVLGRAILDLQADERVLATLEVRQPVYHLTVAR